MGGDASIAEDAACRDSLPRELRSVELLEEHLEEFWRW